MPINIDREKLLSLKDAADVMPRIDGKTVHACTIWRWCRKGLRGVHLEHVRVGHRVATTSAAINRFVNALAEAETLLPSHVSEHATNHAAQPGTQASINRAEAVLARAGI